MDVFVWQITETRADLEAGFRWQSTDRTEFTSISHPLKQTEWLASRRLLQWVCANKNLDYAHIAKDHHGKPYLINSHVGVSITHTSAYAAVAINTSGSVGIDLETMRPKLWRVSERFLNTSEAQQVGNDIEKLCYVWCAKEAVYKCCGQRQVSFKEHISINFSEHLPQSAARARIKTPTFEVHYELHHRFFDNHCLAVAF